MFIVNIIENDEGENLDINKSHVLNALLYDSMKRDRLGRVVIAETKIERVDEDEGDEV